MGTLTSPFPGGTIHSATHREAFWVSTLGTLASEPVMRTWICGTFPSMDPLKERIGEFLSVWLEAVHPVGQVDTSC